MIGKGFFSTSYREWAEKPCRRFDQDAPVFFRAKVETSREHVLRSYTCTRLPVPLQFMQGSSAGSVLLRKCTEIATASDYQQYVCVHMYVCTYTYDDAFIAHYQQHVRDVSKAPIYLGTPLECGEPAEEYTAYAVEYFSP